MFISWDVEMIKCSTYWILESNDMFGNSFRIFWKNMHSACLQFVKSSSRHIFKAYNNDMKGLLEKCLTTPNCPLIIT